MTAIPATITAHQLTEMRGSAHLMSAWPDLVPCGDVNQLTDAEVVSVITNGYEGGAAAFLQDLPH